MPSDEDLEASRVNIFLHAENVRVFTTQERHLPVTIVTGFLGAGKTTLLNYILSNKSNLRIAAAINDFASLNIDENLVKSKGNASSIMELSNGCICCNLLGDLQTAVWKLLQEVELDSINYLVVETSGISDPLAIIRTLDAKFGKCFRARLDSVVTVVDADQFYSTESSPAAVAQLQCADVIILNKVDLLADSEKDCEAVEERIRAMNDNAVIYRTRHCKIPLSAILDVQLAPSTTGVNAITHEATDVPMYVSATGGALRCPSSDVGSKSATTSHAKENDFLSIAETIKEGPLSLAKLTNFVTCVEVRRLARMKGVLWIQGIGERCVLHLSGRGRLGFELDGNWAGPAQSEMAFIGQESAMNPSQLQSAFMECRSLHNNERVAQEEEKNLKVLRNSKEFHVCDNPSSDGLWFFHLTG